MEEIWKGIAETDGKIEVSNLGRVRSNLRGTPYVLKTQKDKKGYHRIRVTYKRQRMSFKLHRLVADAFIPNPENKPQVNHIDGDKDNNAVSNLEWVTNQENAQHAADNGLWETNFRGMRKYNRDRSIPIIACKENEIYYFDSIAAAERHFGSRHITDVLKGKRDRVKGFLIGNAKGVMIADESYLDTTA